MNVCEIVTKYLKENGFDGLCSLDCGCLADDLFPCNAPYPSDCNSGYNNKELAEENECTFWITEKYPQILPSKSNKKKEHKK